MRNVWKSLVQLFVSMQLTVVLLILSMVLVFVATLDQVNLGIWAVQEKYFRSFFVFWRPRPDGWGIPVFPGGYLIGGFLFVNLIAAHVYRFKFTWRKSGIFLTHLGLIILLVGELLSGVWQEDFQMRLDEGQTSNYSESPRFNELAIIDATDPDWDDVVAIPEELLADGKPIQHPKLPFRVVVKNYYPNAFLQMRSQVPNAPPSPATAGIGPQIVIAPQPITYRENERNVPAAVIELIGTDGPIGTWIVSTLLTEPQTFTHEGRTWRLIARSERYYKPYSLTLLNFSHDRYAGTEIPKNFSSKIRLRTDDGGTDREVLIYMNNPLRFQGLTFYQAGFDNNDRTTILQVVRNPSWQLPYIACALMSAGLVIQFGISLTGFFRRRSRSASSAVSPS